LPAVGTPADAERRVVTVLFGDLSDFTAWAEDLDPERVGVVTDRVLAALGRAVTDVGGRVDKLTGDGIMAVFGAPTSHEDDPERAVRAAARMQAELRRLMAEESGGGRRMGLRVGINTGVALAGVQAHLTYTVVGDSVNTASRLSDAARIGSVYAGRETALATMATASWRALPALRLKGKREPVPAYELIGLRPPGAGRHGLGDEAPFIGREAEFGRLVGKLVDVTERNKPASVVITGEAGIGKTRLVVELTRFAGELPDVRVLWGRCTPYGEGRDLAPIASWIRMAAGIVTGEGVDAAAAKARRFLARLSGQQPERPITPAVVDRILALLGLVEWAPLGPRDAATPGTAEPPHDPFVSAAVTVLAAMLATGPLVLVVDDGQWATPALLAALSRIPGRLAGAVMVVVVGRSELLAETWWDSLPDLEALPVTPLDDAASERLLRAYLGGVDLDPAARELLLDRANGNPFFLAELLHLLVDRGQLERGPDGWRLAGELPQGMLPAGVQAVLAARIDGLDPTARAVLRAAAVVGQLFTVDAAAATDPDGLSTAVVERAVDDLVVRGIVRPSVSTEEMPVGFTFVHSLTRDVAYGGMAKAERARRHSRLAAWARQPGWSPSEFDTFVAGHAEQAVMLATEMRLLDDDPAWAARGPGLAALSRLGEAALARDDNVRADALFTRALLVAGGAFPAESLAPVAVSRAAARASLHRLAEAEADLELALTLPDLRVRASALVVLGDLLRRRGDEAGAIEALVSALAAASESGLDRVTGEALRQLGMVDYLLGRLGAAEERFTQALRLAERVEDRRGAGWALQHLAWSATTRGDYALAERTLRQAADVFTRLEDDGGLSWCAGTEAFVRLLQGRLREARDLARGLLPLGRAMNDRWGVAACLTIDGFAAAELGRVEVALEESAEATDIFSAIGDTWGQAMALVAMGVGQRSAGRPADAIETLAQAVEISRTANHAVVGALAEGVLGYCQLDLGHQEAARSAAEQAADALTRLDVRPGALIGLRVLLAQAMRVGGDVGGALVLLREAERFREASLFFPRRQALALLADATLDAGDVAHALVTATDAMGAPAEDVRSRVIALRVLGRCLDAAGDRPAGAVAVRQAEALAVATEMRAELPATRKVLESLRR
jgi:class 3 adenylate cyclase/tetratricopeptide (TPR) repeat protein